MPLELVAGCDLSEELLREFTDRWKGDFPNLTTYTDYREMLSTEQPVSLPSRHVETISVAVGDLINVVANGGVPRCTGQESMRVVEIIFGFLESQRQGNNRVQLPLPRG